MPEQVETNADIGADEKSKSAGSGKAEDAVTKSESIAPQGEQAPAASNESSNNVTASLETNLPVSGQHSETSSQISGLDVDSNWDRDSAVGESDW